MIRKLFSDGNETVKLVGLYSRTVDLISLQFNCVHSTAS